MKNITKSLLTTSLCYSISKSTPSVLLTFLIAEKTKCEISILFVFLPSSCITQKLQGVCECSAYQIIPLLLEMCF